MPGIDEVIERLRADIEFADAVRTDPARTLYEYRLDADDLLRLDRILNPQTHPRPNLFTDPAPPA